MKSKIRKHTLAIFSIVLLCVSLTIKELQNDTFYMIKLGEFIKYKGIDLLDHWSWHNALPYSYPHWLYDLFIFNIYNKFNFLGIYISSIIIFIVMILIIYLIQLKVNKNWFLSYFISIISIICLYGFVTARSQSITIILFFLEVYFLEKLSINGDKKNIFILVFLSFLIANLHATVWMFYFILYLPKLCEHIVFKLKKHRLFKSKIFDSKIIINESPFFKELLLSLILSFFVGLFTPSKICYSYIFKVMLGDSQTFIEEHAPIVIIQHPCFLTFILILVFLLIFTKQKIKLNEFFMLSGLILMCLISVRHLSFFYTIGLFYLSRMCIRYLNSRNDKTLDIMGSLLVGNNLIYCLCIIIIVIFSYNQFQKNYKLDYINEIDYPVKASNFIKENLDINNIRLYNGYNIGSYLMYQDIPVFIDSRCDLYLSEFNGLDYNIFDDEMNILFDYQRVFKFYKITHILISKNELLYQILNNRDEYLIIYEDKNFILFERVI